MARPARWDAGTAPRSGHETSRAEPPKEDRVRSSRFGIEPEIAAKVARLGCRLHEAPIAYHGRTYAEGKKIAWRDGVAALFHVIRYRFFD